MNMRSPVVFDLDGVLADYRAGYRRICRDLGKPEPPVEGRWEDYTAPDVWKIIRASTDFWLSLPALVSYKTFRRVAALRDERDIYFATARPGRHSLWQSARWLESLSIPRPSVVVTHRKGEFARVVDAGFLIDDKAGNCIATTWLSPETATYLLDRPSNQFDHDVVGSKVRRVDTVEEFLDILESE